MRRQLLLIFLLLNLICLSACKSDPQFPAPCWEGKYISFATNASECPCLGTLARIDNLVPDLENLLDEKLPNEEKTQFLWMAEDMAGNPCPEEAVGCATQRTDGERYVFVRRLTDAAHELTHAILFPYFGGHAIFEEGIPTCFGDLHQYYSTTWGDSREDMESLIVQSFSSKAEYLRAGKLVCYLLDRFGIDAVKSLYSQSETNWDKDDFNAVFFSTVGATFDTIIDEYISGEVGCLPIPLSCADSGDVTPWDSAEQLIFAQNMHCADASTQGPFVQIDFTSSDNDKVSIGGTLYFDVSADGYYRICAPKVGNSACEAAKVPGHALVDDSDERTEFVLSRAECEHGQSCLLQPFELSLSRGLEDTLYMDSGRYQLKIRRHLAFGDLYQTTETAEADLKFCRGDGLPVYNECDESKSIRCSDEECRVCAPDVVEDESDGGLPTVCTMCTCEQNTEE